MVDDNDLVCLRARYYHPGLGVFPSLDPMEGSVQQAMSLNRYGYVAGNVVNAVDPSGMISERPGTYEPCLQQGKTPCEECTDDYNAIHGDNPNPPISQSEFCVGVCPPPSSTAIIFFAGSDPKDPNLPGPGPATQTPVWINQELIPGLTEVVEYRGTEYSDAAQTIVETTAKTRQVQDVKGDYSQSNIVVIGYSGGADSAVMWANQYINNPQNSGKVTDLVILGGTMSGTMPTGNDLLNEWETILKTLLSGGTDVYILDDDALGDPNWSSLGCQTNVWTGTCEYVSSDRTHYEEALPGNAPTGTNNDPNLVREILSWTANN